MKPGRSFCRVLYCSNWVSGGSAYLPYEKRITSFSPAVNVPPKRGSSCVNVTDEPPAVELVKVAGCSAPAGMPGPEMAAHGVPGAAPINVSSIGLPPLMPGFTHITLFQALNQKARDAPPAVGGMLNWKRSKRRPRLKCKRVDGVH